ncbi:MAG: hypothetical protein PF961_11615 [Planctomycetota bacterium]|jgi:curli biogenesis system outer membrane secretion channel CsgG|nr:hypothetical protein [Planctomycetota bacterium]
MHLLRGSLILLTLCAVVGCGSSRTEYAADEDTAQVGIYPPPPTGIVRARVGVPPFTITAREAAPDTAEVAADQLSTLAQLTSRFLVIERAQLDQLMKEQGLEGVVRADEAAQVGKVRGVDALLIGKITNFQVKRQEKKGGFGFINIAGAIGGVDVDTDKVEISVEIGVDLRLVDPSDGTTYAAHFGEYKRVDSQSAFGVQILGASAEADADLQLDKDNIGKLLRLALDSTMKKMLGQVDIWLVEKSRETAK